MKDDYFLFQFHVMWYESEMIGEMLDSLKTAMGLAKYRIRIKVCVNLQTYIETPNNNLDIEKSVQSFLKHDAIRNAEVFYKTDKDPFYNIGDWRREVYDKDAKYTIWGESDCLVPHDFFNILERFNADVNPHILSFSSRKMWDDTWKNVEHSELKKYSREQGHFDIFIAKQLCTGTYIDERTLKKFNDLFEHVNVSKISVPKVDGALLCLSGGFFEKFIPENMHFVREDTCLEYYCASKKIPQYNVDSRIKGHNYNHPKKRTNTISTRNDEIFKKYAKESSEAMVDFIKKL